MYRLLIFKRASRVTLISTLPSFLRLAPLVDRVGCLVRTCMILLVSLLAVTVFHASLQGHFLERLASLFRLFCCRILINLCLTELRFKFLHVDLTAPIQNRRLLRHLGRSLARTVEGRYHVVLAAGALVLVHLLALERGHLCSRHRTRYVSSQSRTAGTAAHQASSLCTTNGIFEVDALALHARHGGHLLGQFRRRRHLRMPSSDVHWCLEVRPYVGALKDFRRSVFVNRRCFHFLGGKLVTGGAVMTWLPLILYCPIYG